MTYYEFAAIVKRAEAVLNRLRPVSVGWQSYSGSMSAPITLQFFSVGARAYLWRFYATHEDNGRLCVLCVPREGQPEKPEPALELTLWAPWDYDSAATTLILSLRTFVREAAKYPTGLAFAEALRTKMDAAVTEIEQLLASETK